MGAVDYATKYANARDRIFGLLSDLRWHDWKELEAAGGNRYGARVLELKRQGFDIIDEALPDDGQRYQLRSLERGEPRAKRVRLYVSEASAENVARGLVTEETRTEAKRALGTYKARKDTL